MSCTTTTGDSTKCEFPSNTTATHAPFVCIKSTFSRAKTQNKLTDPASRCDITCRRPERSVSDTPSLLKSIWQYVLAFEHA